MHMTWLRNNSYVTFSFNSVSPINYSLERVSAKLKVRIGRFPCDTFPIHCGLKQGDALSPSLFNFALEYVCH